MSVSDMSSQMKDVRSQMEQDENLRVLMQGFRGKNLSEADFASADVKMNLIEVDSSDSDQLPQVYAPESIEAYWGRRPVSLVRRVLQLLGISGSFLGKLALDAVTGKLKAHEVDRAIELRNIVTSLGPAYIKVRRTAVARFACRPPPSPPPPLGA